MRYVVTVERMDDMNNRAYIFWLLVFCGLSFLLIAIARAAGQEVGEITFMIMGILSASSAREMAGQ